MRSTTVICSASARSGAAPHGLGATRLRLRVLLHRCGFDRDLADGGGVEREPELQLRVPIQREVVLIWRDSIAGIAGPLFNPTSEYLMADVLQRIEEDLDPDQGARR